MKQARVQDEDGRGRSEVAERATGTVTWFQFQFRLNHCRRVGQGLTALCVQGLGLTLSSRHLAATWGRTDASSVGTGS